jgi:hypothetical protein
MSITKDWELYEQGKKFNNALDPNYYELVNANWDFFNGNQWRNLNAKNMPKPTFNIIKRSITFQVASLTTAKSRVRYEPLQHAVTPPGIVPPEEIANAQVETLFEKFKMDHKIRLACTDMAVTGDAAAHFYFDMDKKPYGNAYSDIVGEICMELLDGTNVMFGNANNTNVEAQPYIIVSGRAMVSDLEAEREKYKNKKKDEQVEGDNDYTYQAGTYARIEADGNSSDSKKATYIIVYRKKKIKKTEINEMGVPIEKEVTTIIASKSTQGVYIYEEIDTGLSLYPIAWMNWETQKNCYHGRALATGMLPNQVFINKMFAMCFYHLQLTAFPKAVYNADIIDAWTSEVGTAIGVSGIPPEMSMKNIAGYLEPSQMSTQINQVLQMAWDYTRDSLGINDTALGNADPRNTSAIIAIQKATAIPLENPKANLYQWLEDIGQILFDFMGTKYGTRPVVISNQGVNQVVQYDFSTFKNLFFNVRSDVGESSYWSEISALQTLTNLLQGQQINVIQFLQRVPDEYIPEKQKLIQELEIQQQQMQMQQQMMMQQQAQGMTPPNDNGGQNNG